MSPDTLGVKPLRITSLDTYRGFVMLLMMAEVLHLSSVAEANPNNIILQFLALQQTHVAWAGCTLHDLIQPSFSFLVGAALPFSFKNRVNSGSSTTSIWVHTFRRALILIFLGVFLRSTYASQTNFTFEDTLSQIGLGYPFLFAIGLLSTRFRWTALSVILIGYWLLFALYPLPGVNFDWSQTGITAAWEHNFQGFAAHWNKNTNPAWAFDQWFLNLFPRETPFVFNRGGYVTLSFIPTLGTMILGLIAGQYILDIKTPHLLLKKLITLGLALIIIGAAFHLTGINPIVKRIWTPSWTLFSGGICFLFAAGFYYIFDYKKHPKLAYPLIVIGCNSIAAYVMAHFLPEFIHKSFQIHFGTKYDQILGMSIHTLVAGGLQLLIIWLILRWMYQKKIFVKI